MVNLFIILSTFVDFQLCKNITQTNFSTPHRCYRICVIIVVDNTEKSCHSTNNKNEQEKYELSSFAGWVLLITTLKLLILQFLIQDLDPMNLTPQSMNNISLNSLKISADLVA